MHVLLVGRAAIPTAALDIGWLVWADDADKVLDEDAPTEACTEKETDDVLSEDTRILEGDVAPSPPPSPPPHATIARQQLRSIFLRGQLQPDMGHLTVITSDWSMMRPGFNQNHTSSHKILVRGRRMSPKVPIRSALATPGAASVAGCFPETLTRFYWLGVNACTAANT